MKCFITFTLLIQIEFSNLKWKVSTKINFFSYSSNILFRLSKHTFYFHYISNVINLDSNENSIF